MGEQPKPVEDEVERALSSMRASFLSSAEQVATGIASLEEHLAGAPEKERAAVTAAVTQLVATHEQLTSKVAHLPSSSWDSFKVMVSAVKAQQTVLEQVSQLVQEHVLPRQLEGLQATPPHPAAPPDDDPPPPVSASFIPDDVGSFIPDGAGSFIPDGTGSFIPDGAGSFIPDGTGSFIPDGAGSFIPDGAGSFIPDGTGSFIPDGTGSFIPDGTGSFIPDGTGSFIPDGTGSFIPDGTGSFIPDDVGRFRDDDSDSGDAPLFADGGLHGPDALQGGAPPLFGDGGLLGHDSPRGDDPLPVGFRDGAGYRGEGGVRSPPEAGFPGGAYPAAAGAHRARPPQGGPPEGPADIPSGLRARRDAPGFRALAEAGLRRADEGDDADEEPERRSLFALAGERMAGFRGLAAMAVVGVLLSVLPRDLQLQEMTAKLVELVRPGGDATPAEDPPSTQVVAIEPRSTERRSIERVPPAPGGGAATDGEPAPRRRSSPTPAAAAKEAPARPRPKRVAVVSPAPPRAEKQFVPVVFTHKDKATVQRALSDLKAQYPNVLIGRQGEIVPVDLGKKGIWHRLLVLPAGTRSDASELCAELAAEGYDLCWVKNY